MSQSEKVRLGDVLFQGIDENDYLNELYKNILYNYAITTLRITNIKQLRGINIDDALRFADLLSKSTHPEKSDAHKIWAHEIITMLLALYPEDEVVRYYAGAVLTNTGNFMGKKLVESAYTEPTAMDELFSTLSDIYLTVPAEPDKKFSAYLYGKVLYYAYVHQGADSCGSKEELCLNCSYKSVDK